MRLTSSSAALGGDGQGNLVALYNGDLTGNGVYAVQSTDSGATWSDPVSIFYTNDPQQIAYHLQMATGPSGQIHAVWNVVNAKGEDISAYYARFDAARQEWTEPFVLAETDESFAKLGAGRFGPSYPYVVATDDRVVVLYNANGGPPTNGRPTRCWVAPLY